MENTSTLIGERLRDWRQRRRLSQMDLALDADISTRHLSFLETGRSTPSRDMVLRLAEQLDVPLRERNAMLLAAGYAPVFSDRPLDHTALAPARLAIEALLKAHEPFPALAVDRHWNLIAANSAVAPLISSAAPWLLEAPINVLRLSLHPEGIAPRIDNLAEWRRNLLQRLRHQFDATGDDTLDALIDELSAYPHPPEHRGEIPDASAIAVPLRLKTPDGLLSFISATMVFGTPLDVTMSELAIETFLPADEATAAALRKQAEG